MIKERISHDTPGRSTVPVLGDGGLRYQMRWLGQVSLRRGKCGKVWEERELTNYVSWRRIFWVEQLEQRALRLDG